jgi:hypothetical protein
MPNAEAFRRRLQASTLRLVPRQHASRPHRQCLVGGGRRWRGTRSWPPPPTTAFELSAWGARAGGGLAVHTGPWRDAAYWPRPRGM